MVSTIGVGGGLLFSASTDGAATAGEATISLFFLGDGLVGVTVVVVCVLRR